MMNDEKIRSLGIAVIKNLLNTDLTDFTDMHSFLKILFFFFFFVCARAGLYKKNFIFCIYFLSACRST